MNRVGNSARRGLVLLILTVCLAGFWTLPAGAQVNANAGKDLDTPLRILKESAVYHRASGRVTFTVRFDQHPDFYTTDSEGRPEDLFQYYIVGDPAAPYPTNFDSIIRIEQPWLSKSQLVIRNSAPSSADPTAGGWGSIRGIFRFSLHGDLLTFSVPLSSIRNRRTPGVFTYELDTFHFGAISENLVRQSTTKRCR